MSPYAKCVLAGIHFIALALIALSVVLYSPDLGAKFLLPPGGGHPVSSPLALVCKGIPAVAGLVLFWKGRRLAIYWTRNLD